MEREIEIRIRGRKQGKGWGNGAKRKVREGLGFIVSLAVKQELNVQHMTNAIFTVFTGTQFVVVRLSQSTVLTHVRIF